MEGGGGRYTWVEDGEKVKLFQIFANVLNGLSHAHNFSVGFYVLTVSAVWQFIVMSSTGHHVVRYI